MHYASMVPLPFDGDALVAKSMSIKVDTQHGGKAALTIVNG